MEVIAPQHPFTEKSRYWSRCCLFKVNDKRYIWTLAQEIDGNTLHVVQLQALGFDDIVV